MTPAHAEAERNTKNAMENKSKKVLILTGPGGTGKTTIANLLMRKHDFVKVDGDRLDTEFFPDGIQWLPENSEKLKKAHEKIFSEVKKSYGNGKNNVVLDYIIFGDYLNFFEKFKKEFGSNLEIKVLFPSVKEIIKRDKERKCWTTGQERIKAVYNEFESIKNILGVEKFIDTTEQTSNETFDKYFRK